MKEKLRYIVWACMCYHTTRFSTSCMSVVNILGDNAFYLNIQVKGCFLGTTFSLLRR